MKEKRVFHLTNHGMWLTATFLLLLALALFLTEAGSGEPSAKTLYVDDEAEGGGDGSLEKPFSRIQDAVNAAKPGSTVIVLNGSYVENVLLDKELELVGAGSDVVTIDGSDIGGDLIHITADGVSVRGFTIRDGIHHQPPASFSASPISRPATILMSPMTQNPMT